MPKALVTGATGFVGHYLVRHLSDLGYEVWQGVRLASEMGVEHAVEFDVTDSGSVTRQMERLAPNEVYHLAAVSHPTDSGHLRVNLNGTINVLEGAATVGSKVLVVSSAYVYGNHEGVIEETRPLLPIDRYGASKAAAEMASLNYAYSGNHIVRIRPFNLTGPGQGQQYFVPTLIRQLAEVSSGDGPRSIRLGNLDSVRDYTDVRDFVRACHSALTTGRSGDVYNVATGIGTSMRRLVEMCEEIAGIEVEIVQDPARMRPADIPHLVGSPAKLTALTGHTPKFSLTQTLEDMFSRQLHG